MTRLRTGSVCSAISAVPAPYTNDNAAAGTCKYLCSCSYLPNLSCYIYVICPQLLCLFSMLISRLQCCIHAHELLAVISGFDQASAACISIGYCMCCSCYCCRSSAMCCQDCATHATTCCCCSTYSCVSAVAVTYSCTSVAVTCSCTYAVLLLLLLYVCFIQGFCVDNVVLLLLLLFNCCIHRHVLLQQLLVCNIYAVLALS